jgi:hypothetical protein
MSFASPMMRSNIAGVGSSGTSTSRTVAPSRPSVAIAASTAASTPGSIGAKSFVRGTPILSPRTPRASDPR